MYINIYILLIYYNLYYFIFIYNLYYNIFIIYIIFDDKLYTDWFHYFLSLLHSYFMSYI